MTPSCGPATFRYRAFISYSHRDKAWADWLHKALETYRVPMRLVGQTTPAGVIPRRLAPIFRDRDELASATDLGRQVNAAIAECANLIVICSPRSATSPWVDTEVLAFKRLGRSERVFCLIVDGEPNASVQPGHEAEECFAPALRFQIGADGQPTTTRTEPIAADVRSGKDGKGNAKLKLIAGMLDVSFDALKQRELQRRNRRLAAITAMALAVMTVTSVLAISALIARHAATTAQAAAERRQKQAEGLVGFMLGDLSDKLTQVGRLDIMQAVDDKAMAYFASMPVRDVTDTALAQRAKAMEKIGYVRQVGGHLPEAMTSFLAARKITAALAMATPTNAARQLRYARILALIGQTYWNQGQLDAAQDSFTAAQGVLLRAWPYASHDRVFQFELEMIDNDLGHVLEAHGRLDAALVPYRSALELSRQLVAADPARKEWAVELGGAHNNLGKLALLHGDLVTAIAEYAADDAIESGLSARDPRDNDQRNAALVVHAILGRTLALTGADATAMRYLQQAVETAAALVQVDPHNDAFQDDLARYSVQLARLKRLNRNLIEARAMSAQSLATLLGLVRQDPTNAGLHADLAATLIEQAAESLAAGQAKAVRAQLPALLDELDASLKRQPHARPALLAKLDAQLLLANASTDPRTAAQLRKAVFDAAQSQPSGKGDPRLLALQVEALLALGNTGDAQPLTRQLWTSGYRDAELLVVLHGRRIAYPVNAAFQQRLLAISPGAGRSPDHIQPPRKTTTPTDMSITARIHRSSS
ncbi:MAG: toll/interleukin-1 receptor domain-containing protein [Rhodanobacter sp.]